jgi:hypothetical protein
MKNPFGPDPESLPSYAGLKKRMLQHVKSSKVHDQIFQVVQNSFENALRHENIVLSRPERMRLFSQILKSVLEDMIKKLDDHSSAS